MTAAADGRGRLVLVGTPIGNLGDLAPRAIETLAAADLIACEDTRRTGRLLAHAGVEAPRLTVIEAHREAAAAADLVARMVAGATVAVVTDAGMPGISDPGHRLVAAAVDAGIPVEVVPGPSAAVAALVVSGLPTDRFVMEGFLPRKGPERAARLAAIAAEERTVVVFESPHRAAATVADLAGTCGDDRPVAVARELTKLHEEVWRGTASGAAAWLADHPPKGELVLVVGGRPPQGPPTDDEVRAAVAAELAAGASPRDAAAAVAETLGCPKRAAYAVAVDLSRGGSG